MRAEIGVHVAVIHCSTAEYKRESPVDRARQSEWDNPVGLLPVTGDVHMINWAGALVQWLKLSAWKIGDQGLEPRSGLQVSNKQKISPRSLVKIHYCGEPP